MTHHSTKAAPSRRQLLQEVARLRSRLEEIEGTSHAAHGPGQGNNPLFPSNSAEDTYRAIAETMNEAAVTTTISGTVLFCNARFGQLLQMPPEKIIGQPLQRFLLPGQDRDLGEMACQAWNHPTRGRLVFTTEGGVPMPVLVSTNILHLPTVQHICVVATDLTELENSMDALRRLEAQQLALLASEEQYRNLVQLARCSIIRFDLAGRVTLFNEYAQEFFGYTEAEVVGRPVVDTILASTESTGRDLSAMLEGIIQHPEQFGYNENENIRKDGERVWVAWTNRVVRGPEGEIREILSIGMDITERRHMEEALRRSEEEFRAIFELAGSGMAEVKLATRKFLRVNQKFREITGYSDRELRDLSPHDITHPDDRQASETQMQQAASGENSSYTLEKRYIRKDGQAVWVLVTAATIHDGNGCPDRMIAVVQDVSDRKWAEEALRKSEDDFRTIFELSSSGKVEIDLATNRFLRVNRKMCEITGYSREEMLAMDFRNVLHPEDRDMAMPDIQQLLSGESPGYTRERRYLRKDGTVAWVYSSAAVVRDAQGQPLRIIGVIQDITDRKQAEIALKQTAAELARSNRDLEQFAYVASHDLQEPLRMVTGYLQLLERRYKDQIDKTANEFIAFAVDGAARMQNLIADLLAYSRVGTRVQTLEDTDLQAVLDRCLANLRSAIQDSGAKISWDPLPTIRADSSQMLQLLQNLLSNAIKFRGDSPPRIHIGARRHEGRWLFSVADNGIGVDPQCTDKIFVIFQRLHGRDKYPGTGIGLAICKKIVERHGGRIWVESQLGQGSTFHFTL